MKSSIISILCRNEDCDWNLNEDELLVILGDENYEEFKVCMAQVKFGMA